MVQCVWFFIFSTDVHKCQNPHTLHRLGRRRTVLSALVSVPGKLTCKSLPPVSTHSRAKVREELQTEILAGQLADLQTNLAETEAEYISSQILDHSAGRHSLQANPYQVTLRSEQHPSVATVK